MKILVTGAKGQLGSHIRLLAMAGANNSWLFTDIDTLDIADAKAVERYVEVNEVGCIVNCAAYTNVDGAEDAEDEADMANNVAAGVLANAMAARDGVLVHVSTDYVFGGNLFNTPCDETMETNPLGVYGRTKLAGEKAIEATGCKHIIIRTAWLYSEYGKNFVKTMLGIMGSRKEVKVVYDQVGTPTYAGDLAKVIFDMVDNGHYEGALGLYNYTDEGVCSWYDFAQAIGRLSGSGCRVSPCRSSEYASKVTRPSYSVLDKSKIKRVFGLDIPYWEESLQLCINNLTK